MAHAPAGPVPPIPGIDLSFRPRTYFGPIPADTHVLARIGGRQRRDAARRILEDVRGAALGELAATVLQPEDRDALGRLHPWLMGGEYLPPFRPGETEIARISLASTTMDQISVRAQRIDRRIRYRIVDEYDGAYGEYSCDPAESDAPLTLGKLARMIDCACGAGGAVFSHLDRNAYLGVDLMALENFVEIGSEFYGQLGAYYRGRIDQWLMARTPEEQTEPDE